MVPLSHSMMYWVVNVWFNSASFHWPFPNISA